MIKQKGLTIIELLVVVAIAGILASVAVPTYKNYVLKAKVREAQSNMMSLSLVVESIYQRQLAYPSLDAGKTVYNDPKFDKRWKPSSDEFTYAYVNDSDEGGYKITATGTGNLSSCVMTFNGKGEKKIDATSNKCANVKWE